MKLILALVTSLLVSLTVSANSFQRPTVEPTCYDEVEYCFYVTQNVSASDLKSKIFDIMFSSTIISSTVGFVKVESSQKISFWFHDEDTKDRFSKFLTILDVFDQFHARPSVHIVTEIYSVSDNALRNIEASILSATDKPADDVADWALSRLDSGNISIPLVVGSNLFNSILGSSSVKGETSMIETLNDTAINNSRFNLTKNTPVYVSPGSVTVKENTAGIEVSGNVSISRDNPNLIRVRNFNFRYGLKTKESSVEVLSFNRNEIYLNNGESKIIVSTTSNFSHSSNEGGLLRIGRNKEQMYSKTLIILRARPVMHETPAMEDSRTDLLNSGGVSNLGLTEVRSLPSGTSSVKEAIKNIRPYVYELSGGNKVIGFKISKSGLTKENYKKNVQIKVKGGSVNLKRTLSLEELATDGIRFPELKQRDLEKDHIKFTIKMKEFKSGAFNWTRSKIYYNPQTSKFIEL